MILLTISIGFVLGALTIIGIEILGFLFLVQRLNRKVKDQEIKPVSREVHGDHFNLSYPNKQGPVWVLEVEKIPKNCLTDKGPKEQKRKKEIVEVTPVRKFAKLKDQLLIIKESDGSCIEIWLKDCTIAAVSATNLASRKWAKRYPIKMESKKSMIYHGSKSLYIYFETSLEKESWCKALRIASSVTNEKLKSFAKLRLEFQNYLTALNTEHPTLMKPTMGFNAEAIDKSIKIDGSSSKVRHFLKKLAKKTSKSGIEYMANRSSTLGRDEKNISEKSRSFQGSVSATGFLKPAPIGKATNSLEENILPFTFTHSGSSSGNVSVVSDADSDDKNFSDEGTLCLTLLLSRLFFDAKSNLEIKSFVQARIQRSLSNMRIPSYIGEVICTGIHLGNLPPYIHGMRVLPSDMNDILALEIDIEYCGGVMLDIETRVEVCDKDLSEGMSSNLESTSGEEVASDLLEGFEYFGNQLKLSEGTAEKLEGKEGDPKLDKTKSFKSSIQGSSYTARWKSILNSIAKQVSQVPLSLGIRVASLRGTLRLQIKAPPSDQLWFGFTSMPDIDLNLESSVGEHKITSGQIALLLINRFKAAIRETMVLPNFESIYIPWMLAEKDDWLPRQFAPFIWVNQEAAGDSTTGNELPSSQTVEAPRTSEASRETQPECKENKVKKIDLVQQPTKESSLTSLGPTDLSIPNEKPLEELKTPLLGNNEAAGPSQWNKEEHMDSQEPTPETRSPSRSVSLMDDENHTMPGDDARPKRMGSTRARMLGLGKKMGEKLEERRRHIEEKGRNIVERMREGHKN